MKDNSLVCLLLVAFLLASTSPSGWGLAQVEQAWVARYDFEAENDYSVAVAVDSAGNVYVTGMSGGVCDFICEGGDYATVKYDPEGNQLWVARYEGPGGERDHATALAVDLAGNVYVTGTENIWGDNPSFATVKYDPEGSQLWVARYDDPPGVALALAVNSAGNVFVTGQSGSEYATVKYDPDGNELWVARYDGPGDADWATAMALDSTGNVYVTGQASGSGTNRDYATVKYDPEGNELWVARYDGPGDGDGRATALALDSTGNVYVTGGSVGSGTGFDYATVKYDTDGNELWVARYEGTLYDVANALALDSAGNIYVTGSSNQDFATLKYDSEGNELWVARYDGPPSMEDGAVALAVDSVGNVFVTGYSDLWGDEFGRETGYATVKYDSDGNELWVARYGKPRGWTHDVSEALALDAAGNVYVTGASMGSGTGFDYATIKYAQSSSVWFRRGDTNGDGMMTVSDVVTLCFQLFLSAPMPCPDASDVGDNGVVEIADAAWLMRYLFRGGAPPEPPFPECGNDVFPNDPLTCEAHPACQ